MTDKITLSTVGNLIDATTAQNTINNNFTTIQTAFDNTFSRDGTVPNQVEHNLDMNSFQMLNLPTPATAQSPLRLQDLSSFVGGGSVSNIPVGGAVGQVLTKRSTTDYDIDWENIEHTGYDPRAYGAKGDGVTDDSTAITNCITAARAAGATMIINDGVYVHSQTLNWAWNNFKVLAIGCNVVFKHTGTGVGHQFSGMVNYPASQGCVCGVFGGPNRIFLRGNINTTNLVLVDNWHFGEMKISGKDASSAILRAQDTGIVGASAVETTYDVQISQNVDGLYTVVPWYGILAFNPASCIFVKPIVEQVGNVANSTNGITLVNGGGNIFLGGTVESCLAGGISLNGTKRTTFYNVDVEVNGTQNDWIITGSNNTFINCSGAGTTTGQYISGNYNKFIGCQLQSVQVVAGATGNTFDNCYYLVAFTDNGTNTTVINPDVFATPTDNSPSILGNKTINTTNNVTLKINSKQVTDLSGTGSVLVTTVSPTITTPAINGTPTGTAFGTGVAAFLGTPSSANLKAAITDETGSGSVVFATSPALVTPVLGTPTSGTLTSCTGLPLTTGVTGTLPRANGGGATSVAGEQAALSMGMLGFYLAGANFNSTADQTITITLPTGFTRYRFQAITVSNPSVSLTTAVGGMYTAASKGGTVVIPATQVYSTLTTNTAGANGSLFLPTVNNTTTAFYNSATLFLSLTTPQGSAATADVAVYIQPIP